MVLRMAAGHRTGENIDDLQQWLRELANCPQVNKTVVASCRNDRHVDDPATWFYVEADPRNAIARRRCLSCGDAHHVLDSADHWTAPRMWGCQSCGQSIAEVAAGVHLEGDNDDVTWVVLGARCVDCGTLSGLTDFSITPRTFDAIADSL